jgi:heme oxygenase
MAGQLLSEKLKIMTLANHQQVEKQLITQLRSMRSHDDYIGVLQCFYAYFTALEHKVHRYIGVQQLPDMQQRRKSGNLLLDLTALNGNIPPIAPDNYLPAILNQAQAFGALYMMEGSTLGGQVICKLVEKQLTLATSLSFFRGYGDNTYQMWNDFKSVLDMQREEDAVINAANETFAGFSSWLSRPIRD